MWIQHHVVLIGGIAIHICTVRGDGPQLDCQRVLAARGFVVAHRRASAASAVPVLQADVGGGQGGSVLLGRACC